MDKYLLQILHDVNTIIIPGLGALTITNAKTGEMMFMSYLKYDDGKLSACISEKEGMSENDAKNLIAKYVREIQAKLDKGDTYDMFQFGRFLKNKEGDVDFESWGSYASNDIAYSEENQASETEQEINVAPVEPEIEEIVIPVPEEIAPEEKPEVADKPAEEELHTEELTVPEFEETAQTENQSSEDNDVIEDRAVTQNIAPAASLDEILERSEEPTIDAAPNEETTMVTEEIQPEVQESVKPDPIANQTQDESRVQVENIYIPPSESPTPEPVVQPEKPAPNLNKKKEQKPASKPEPKPKKKRGVGFWILISLIILLVLGGVTTVLFYDKVKTYIPFLESKRIEAEQKKDTATSAEELNENAAALEAAEAERVTGESQPEETEPAEVADEPAVVEQEPAAEPVAVSSDGSNPYHVIGGAFGNKDNADRYAAKNSGTVIGQVDGMYLVSIGSYASKQEANAAINGKGWVFKKK